MTRAAETQFADTLNSVIREGKLDLTEIGLDDERIRSSSQECYRGIWISVSWKEHFRGSSVTS